MEPVIWSTEERNFFVPIICVEKDNCRELEILDRMFLLLIVTEGMARFQVGEREITAVAPCFVAFSEEYSPKLLEQKKLKARSVYFHPSFLNRNMTFAFMRSPHYEDIAMRHNMFLMEPFLEHRYIIPILREYLPRILDAFEEMRSHIRRLEDPYWPCRTRAGFIDMVMMLERHYRLLLDGKLSFSENPGKEIVCPYVERAVAYMETHYMEKLAFSDIQKASRTNHTTLTRNFKEQMGLTVMEYLQDYRIKVAKKQLEFTDIPLKDVARQCGFSTTEHFSRVFSSVTGKPPAAYRKQAVEKRKQEVNPLSGQV